MVSLRNKESGYQSYFFLKEKMYNSINAQESVLVFRSTKIYLRISDTYIFKKQLRVQKGYR